MGYELGRFIGKIDDEFRCAVCTMILENPVQSPCEHTFCDECIKEWISVEKSCPVDRRSLNIVDLKPTPRYFRNMLDKLDIKCDFFADGCRTIIKLEHLIEHLASCEFNWKSEIVCDKGCNLRIIRREYDVNNCVTHLANRVKSQQEQFENAMSNQQNQIEKLSNDVSRQEVEIKKLSDEVNQLRRQVQNFENLLSRPQEKFSKAPKKGLNKSNILLNSPTKCHWQLCYNMKISVDQPNIMEFGGYSGNAFAQLFYPLDAATTSFKIKILNAGSDNAISIGLTRQGHLTELPPGYQEYSAGFRSSREITVNKKYQSGQKWEVGDIIECGIKVSKNFVYDGRGDVNVYFSVNEQLVTKNLINLSRDQLNPRLFPTIFIWHTRTGGISKVEYLSN